MIGAMGGSYGVLRTLKRAGLSLLAFVSALSKRNLRQRGMGGKPRISGRTRGEEGEARR